MMGMWPMSLLRRWGAAFPSCTMISRCKAPLYVRPCKPKPCEALAVSRDLRGPMTHSLTHQSWPRATAQVCSHAVFMSGCVSERGSSQRHSAFEPCRSQSGCKQHAQQPESCFDSADTVGLGTPLSMEHTASRQSLGNSLLSASPDASSFTGLETRGFSNHILWRLLVPGCSICSSNATENGPLLDDRYGCLHSGCQSGNRRYVKQVTRFAVTTSIGLSRLTTVCRPSPIK